MRTVHFVDIFTNHPFYQNRLYCEVKTQPLISKLCIQQSKKYDLFFIKADCFRNTGTIDGNRVCSRSFKITTQSE